MYSKTEQPVRSLDELRKLSYAEMNSREINTFRDLDPAAYTELINKLDGTKTPNPDPVSAATPEPIKQGQGYWRNGQWIDVSAANSFINGIKV